MDTMSLTKQIVDEFYKKREKREDYIVRVDLAPNPLNFDGCDGVEARVVRRDKTAWEIGKPPVYAETVVLESGHAWTLEEALTKLFELASV